jgi:citrate/tricarballylate utilization protein
VTPFDELLKEGRRQLEICDACRYCEGYCPVFPALARGGVTDGDVVFLANVCHDCRACFQACMYTAPHEFAVDIPAALTAVRAAGYGELTWPGRLGWTVRNPLATKLGALAIGLLTAVALTALHGTEGFTVSDDSAGSFYRVIPAETMTGFFLALTALVFALMIGGLVRFWRVTRPARPTAIRARDIASALAAAATLRHGRGGGGECYVPDPDRPSGTRRIAHLMLVYGLVLTFAATVTAAIEQHLLGRLPPYPFWSAAPLLGSVGGVGVIVGAAGLAIVKRQASAKRAVGERVSGYVFMASLEIVAVSGMLLLALRAGPLMPALLLVHLGSVTALYLTMPLGKFVHAVHRLGAIVLDAAEKRAAERTG